MQNTYTQNGDGNEFSVRYPIMRMGGETQSRFNWREDALNLCHDWFYITQSTTGWEETYDWIVNLDHGEILTQIPAMGWIGRSQTKQWSFSQAKYGEQQSNECSNTYGKDNDDNDDEGKNLNKKDVYEIGQNPFTTKYRQSIVDGKKRRMKKLLAGQGRLLIGVGKKEAIENGWCSQDAGNGIWTNGSNVVGNDYNDANIQTNESDAFEYTNAILEKYGSNAPVFEIDNEPCLWHVCFKIHTKKKH